MWGTWKVWGTFLTSGHLGGQPHLFLGTDQWPGNYIHKFTSVSLESSVATCALVSSFMRLMIPTEENCCGGNCASTCKKHFQQSLTLTCVYPIPPLGITEPQFSLARHNPPPPEHGYGQPVVKARQCEAALRASSMHHLQRNPGLHIKRRATRCLLSPDSNRVTYSTHRGCHVESW